MGLGTGLKGRHTGLIRLRAGLDWVRDGLYSDE